MLNIELAKSNLLPLIRCDASRIHASFTIGETVTLMESARLALQDASGSSHEGTYQSTTEEEEEEEDDDDDDEDYVGD